jgi:hypothetical protein
MLKKAILILAIVLLIAFLNSCRECGNCYYILPDESEVDLGEYCDEDKQSLLQSGYSDTSGTHDVVCRIH